MVMTFYSKNELLRFILVGELSLLEWRSLHPKTHT